MKIEVDIDENIYTRLFDNGIQDNEIEVDDVCEIAKALRLGTPIEQESKTEKVIKMRDATTEERESVDKYIKSISKPTGVNFWEEQEPCEDCISRAELLKAIDTWDKFGFDHTGCFVREPKDDFITYVHYDDVIKCIKGMPSVTPKPQTGHWIKNGEIWKCSECGESSCCEGKFCNECGAKMVEPQESQKVNCKSTKCENCTNHNYCDYEPQKSEVQE